MCSHQEKFIGFWIFINDLETSCNQMKQRFNSINTALNSNFSENVSAHNTHYIQVDFVTFQEVKYDLTVSATKDPTYPTTCKQTLRRVGRVPKR